MSPFRHLRRIQHLRDIPRVQLRYWLKVGSRGDKKAYLSLIRCYINLVLEYLYFSGFEVEEERREVARKIFHGAWSRLQYANRVSDFEYLLFRILILHSAPIESIRDSLARQIANLPPYQRFALVAREMEDWHPYWIGLAGRVKPKTISQWLKDSRCLLAHLESQDLCSRNRRVLKGVSRSFDRDLSDSKKLKLARHLEEYPRVKAFKSEWLELRCALIELRQDLRLPDEDQETFILELGMRLTADSFIQPLLIHRIFNFLRFNRFPEYNPS